MFQPRPQNIFQGTTLWLRFGLCKAETPRGSPMRDGKTTSGGNGLDQQLDIIPIYITVPKKYFSKDNIKHGGCQGILKIGL
jgi:hypothetical protein